MQAHTCVDDAWPSVWPEQKGQKVGVLSAAPDNIRDAYAGHTTSAPASEQIWIRGSVSSDETSDGRNLVSSTSKEE